MKPSFPDELISAYLDGELDAEQTARVEQAMRDDAELCRMHDQLRALRSTLQAMPRYAPGEDLTERVLRQAERRGSSGEQTETSSSAAQAAAAPVVPASKTSPTRNWRLLVGGLAAAAALLLIALSGPWLANRQVATFTAPETDDSVARDASDEEAGSPTPPSAHSAPAGVSATMGEPLAKESLGQSLGPPQADQVAAEARDMARRQVDKPANAPAARLADKQPKSDTIRGLETLRGSARANVGRAAPQPSPAPSMAGGMKSASQLSVEQLADGKNERPEVAATPILEKMKKSGPAKRDDKVDRNFIVVQVRLGDKARKAAAVSPQWVAQQLRRQRGEIKIVPSNKLSQPGEYWYHRSRLAFPRDSKSGLPAASSIVYAEGSEQQLHAALALLRESGAIVSVVKPLASDADSAGLVPGKAGTKAGTKTDGLDDRRQSGFGGGMSPGRAKGMRAMPGMALPSGSPEAELAKRQHQRQRKEPEAGQKDEGAETQAARADMPAPPAPPAYRSGGAVAPKEFGMATRESPVTYIIFRLVSPKPASAASKAP